MGACSSSQKRSSATLQRKCKKTDPVDDNSREKRPLCSSFGQPHPRVTPRSRPPLHGRPDSTAHPAVRTDPSCARDSEQDSPTTQHRMLNLKRKSDRNPSRQGQPAFTGNGRPSTDSITSVSSAEKIGRVKNFFRRVSSSSHPTVVNKQTHATPPVVLSPVAQTLQSTAQTVPTALVAYFELACQALGVLHSLPISSPTEGGPWRIRDFYSRKSSESAATVMLPFERPGPLLGKWTAGPRQNFKKRLCTNQSHALPFEWVLFPATAPEVLHFSQFVQALHAQDPFVGAKLVRRRARVDPIWPVSCRVPWMLNVITLRPNQADLTGEQLSMLLCDRSLACLQCFDPYCSPRHPFTTPVRRGSSEHQREWNSDRRRLRAALYYSEKYLAESKMLREEAKQHACDRELEILPTYIETGELFAIPVEQGGLDGPSFVPPQSRGLITSVMEQQDEAAVHSQSPGARIFLEYELEPMCGGLMWKKILQEGISWRRPTPSCIASLSASIVVSGIETFSRNIGFVLEGSLEKPSRHWTRMTISLSPPNDDIPVTSVSFGNLEPDTSFLLQRLEIQAGREYSGSMRRVIRDNLVTALRLGARTMAKDELCAFSLPALDVLVAETSSRVDKSANVFLVLQLHTWHAVHPVYVSTSASQPMGYLRKEKYLRRCDASGTLLPSVVKGSTINLCVQQVSDLDQPFETTRTAPTGLCYQWTWTFGNSSAAKAYELLSEGRGRLYIPPKLLKTMVNLEPPSMELSLFARFLQNQLVAVTGVIFDMEVLVECEQPYCQPSTYSGINDVPNETIVPPYHDAATLHSTVLRQLAELQQTYTSYARDRVAALLCPSLYNEEKMRTAQLCRGCSAAQEAFQIRMQQRGECLLKGQLDGGDVRSYVTHHDPLPTSTFLSPLSPALPEKSHGLAGIVIVPAPLAGLKQLKDEIKLSAALFREPRIDGHCPPLLTVIELLDRSFLVFPLTSLDSPAGQHMAATETDIFFREHPEYARNPAAFGFLQRLNLLKNAYLSSLSLLSGTGAMILQNIHTLLSPASPSQGIVGFSELQKSPPSLQELNSLLIRKPTVSPIPSSETDPVSSPVTSPLVPSPPVTYVVRPISAFPRTLYVKRILPPVISKEILFLTYSALHSRFPMQNESNFHSDEGLNDFDASSATDIERVIEKRRLTLPLDTPTSGSPVTILGFSRKEGVMPISVTLPIALVSQSSFMMSTEGVVNRLETALEPHFGDCRPVWNADSLAEFLFSTKGLVDKSRKLGGETASAEASTVVSQTEDFNAGGSHRSQQSSSEVVLSVQRSSEYRDGSTAKLGTSEQLRPQKIQEPQSLSEQQRSLQLPKPQVAQSQGNPLREKSQCPTASVSVPYLLDAGGGARYVVWTSTLFPAIFLPLSSAINVPHSSLFLSCLRSLTSADSLIFAPEVSQGQSKALSVKASPHFWRPMTGHLPCDDVSKTVEAVLRVLIKHLTTTLPGRRQEDPDIHMVLPLKRPNILAIFKALCRRYHLKCSLALWSVLEHVEETTEVSKRVQQVVCMELFNKALRSTCFLMKHLGRPVSVLTLETLMLSHQSHIQQCINKENPESPTQCVLSFVELWLTASYVRASESLSKDKRPSESVRRVLQTMIDIPHTIFMDALCSYFCLAGYAESGTSTPLRAYLTSPLTDLFESGVIQERGAALSPPSVPTTLCSSYLRLKSNGYDDCTLLRESLLYHYAFSYGERAQSGGELKSCNVRDTMIPVSPLWICPMQLDRLLRVLIQDVYDDLLSLARSRMSDKNLRCNIPRALPVATLQQLLAAQGERLSSLVCFRKGPPWIQAQLMEALHCWAGVMPSRLNFGALTAETIRPMLSTPILLTPALQAVNLLLGVCFKTLWYFDAWSGYYGVPGIPCETSKDGSLIQSTSAKYCDSGPFEPSSRGGSCRGSVASSSFVHVNAATMPLSSNVSGRQSPTAPQEIPDCGPVLGAWDEICHWLPPVLVACRTVLGIAAEAGWKVSGELAVLLMIVEGLFCLHAFGDVTLFETQFQKALRTTEMFLPVEASLSSDGDATAERIGEGVSTNVDRQIHVSNTETWSVDESPDFITHRTLRQDANPSSHPLILFLSSSLATMSYLRCEKGTHPGNHSNVILEKACYLFRRELLTSSACPFSVTPPDVVPRELTVAWGSYPPAGYRRLLRREMIRLDRDMMLKKKEYVPPHQRHYSDVLSAAPDYLRRKVMNDLDPKRLEFLKRDPATACNELYPNGRETSTWDQAEILLWSFSKVRHDGAAWFRSIGFPSDAPTWTEVVPLSPPQRKPEQVSRNKVFTVGLNATAGSLGVGWPRYVRHDDSLYAIAPEYEQQNADLLDDGLDVWWTGQPIEVPSLEGLGVVQLAAGEHHTLARTMDGRLLAWGSNKWGQCGIPQDESQQRETTDASQTKVVSSQAWRPRWRLKKPSSSRDTYDAVMQYDIDGYDATALRLPLLASADRLHYELPVISYLFPPEAMTYLTSSQHERNVSEHPHTSKSAVLPNDSAERPVISLEADHYDRDYLLPSAVVVPRQIKRFWKPEPTVSTDNQVPGMTIETIACGAEFSVALASDGSIYTWGNNADGCLGDGGESGSYSCRPTQIHATQIAPLMLKEIWGSTQLSKDPLGPLDVVASPSRTSLVAPSSYLEASFRRRAELHERLDSYYRRRLHRAAEIACGPLHVGMVDRDGGLWMWGQGEAGQLGFPYSNLVSSPAPQESKSLSYRSSKERQHPVIGYNFPHRLRVFVRSCKAKYDVTPDGRQMLSVWAGCRSAIRQLLRDLKLPEDNKDVLNAFTFRLGAELDTLTISFSDTVLLKYSQLTFSDILSQTVLHPSEVVFEKIACGEGHSIAAGRVAGALGFQMLFSWGQCSYSQLGFLTAGLTHRAIDPWPLLHERSPQNPTQPLCLPVDPDNEYTSRPTPCLIMHDYFEDKDPVTVMRAGGCANLLIFKSGKARVWGGNDFSVLGLSEKEYPEISEPLLLPITTTCRVRDGCFAMGAARLFLITAERELICFGKDNYGASGRLASTRGYSVFGQQKHPPKAPDPPDFDVLNTWPRFRLPGHHDQIVAVASGMVHTAVVGRTTDDLPQQQYDQGSCVQGSAQSPLVPTGNNAMLTERSVAVSLPTTRSCVSWRVQSPSSPILYRPLTTTSSSKKLSVAPVETNRSLGPEFRLAMVDAGQKLVAKQLHREEKSFYTDSRHTLLKSEQLCRSMRAQSLETVESLEFDRGSVSAECGSKDGSYHWERGVAEFHQVLPCCGSFEKTATPSAAFIPSLQQQEHVGVTKATLMPFDRLSCIIMSAMQDTPGRYDPAEVYRRTRSWTVADTTGRLAASTLFGITAVDTQPLLQGLQALGQTVITTITEGLSGFNKYISPPMHQSRYQRRNSEPLRIDLNTHGRRPSSSDPKATSSHGTRRGLQRRPRKDMTSSISFECPQISTTVTRAASKRQASHEGRTPPPSFASTKNGSTPLYSSSAFAQQPRSSVGQTHSASDIPLTHTPSQWRASGYNPPSTQRTFEYDV